MIDSTLITKPEYIAHSMDKLSDIISKMKENKMWTVPVIKDRKLLGLISYKDLLSRRVSLETKAINVMNPSVTVQIDEDINRLIAKFYTTKARVIPVVNEKKEFIGFVTRESLLSYLLKADEIPENKTAREYMTSPATTIDENDSIARARWVMIRDNISRLPATKEYRLTGIISARDIVDALYSVSGRKRESIMKDEERVMAMPVKEIMKYPVITANGKEPLPDVVEKLLKFRISGMPVMEGDRLSGVISGLDIIKAVAEKMQLSIPIEAKIPQELKSNLDFKANIDDILERYLSKIERLTEVINFKVSFKEEMRSRVGNKKLYTAMVRVTTKIGDYVAKDTDWEPIVALKNAVEKIEERILRKLRKIEESNKKGIKAEEA
ncbi:CBS domain-containing protein [Saccharolobus islandicus]|uniref:CBS domain containing protein n=1 Tax=Saccharolobus islandicus (strain L.D.8.5 / Lassen \|nr:CBS domain-containing protein [Sulfolobus islandicus]ADB87997.1 CBS domain containing protein [Sulfolobus islandicus L.D.8.5]